MPDNDLFRCSGFARILCSTIAFSVAARLSCAGAILVVAPAFFASLTSGSVTFLVTNSLRLRGILVL